MKAKKNTLKSTPYKRHPRSSADYAPVKHPEHPEFPDNPDNPDIPENPENPGKRLDWRPGTVLYPLPAVLVTCGDAQTGANVCTVAWTGTLCSDPPTCYVSLRPSRHSYGIIKHTHEFVINLTTERLARATDWCGVRSGRDYDKFKECGLTPRPATKVACPLLAESPLALECKVKNVIPLGSHDMFVAEVVGVNVDGRFLDPRTEKFDLAAARPLVYVHGQYYALGKPLGKFGFSVEKKRPGGRAAAKTAPKRDKGARR